MITCKYIVIKVYVMKSSNYPKKLSLNLFGIYILK